MDPFYGEGHRVLPAVWMGAGVTDTGSEARTPDENETRGTRNLWLGATERVGRGRVAREVQPSSAAQGEPGAGWAG